MPMSLAEMERNLVALRLPGMKETLETRALQANQGDEPFVEIFAYLVQDEIDYRFLSISAIDIGIAFSFSFFIPCLNYSLLP